MKKGRNQQMALQHASPKPNLQKISIYATLHKLSKHTHTHVCVCPQQLNVLKPLRQRHSSTQFLTSLTKSGTNNDKVLIQKHAYY